MTADPGPPARAPGTLRVVTFNTLAPDQADGPRRRQVAGPALRALAPDVVALQEVTEADPRRLLGNGYELAPHSRRSDDGVGACLASRWPITSVEEVDQHVSRRTEGLPWCATVLVEIEAPAPLGSLLVVHHKPSWQRGLERERERQAVRAARVVERRLTRRPAHVVLLGDQDATPDSASIRFWTGLQSLDGDSVCYRDAWAATHPAEPGFTLSRSNPLVRDGEMPLELGRRIDYVMVRCEPHGPTLDVLDCRLLFDRPIDGTWASDHFGVLADLAVLRRPAGSWA